MAEKKNYHLLMKYAIRINEKRFKYLSNITED